MNKYEYLKVSQGHVLQYLYEDAATCNSPEKKSGLRAYTIDKCRDIDRFVIQIREVQFATSNPIVATYVSVQTEPNNVGFGRDDMQIATSNGNRWPLIWRAERLMPYGTANDSVRVYQTERLCYSASVLPLHAILSLFRWGIR